MNEELSVSHSGNIKLGKKISVFSRPVGDTCSNSCIHLDNGCYAERIEYRFPNARKAYLKNVKIANWQKLRAFLLEANKRDNIVRWHQNGDVMKQDSLGRKILDIKYIKDIEKANQSIIDDGQKPPLQFMYTHSLLPRVAKLSKYIILSASGEDTATYKKAKKAGFKLYAWISSLKKEKDKNKSWITETGKKVVVCFEQLGNKSDCVSCGFCFKPNINLDIAFMQH